MKSTIPIPLSVYDGKVVDQPENEMWVRGGDFPANVARKLLESIQKNGTVLIAAIGPKAINQAVKGTSIARQMWRDGTEEKSDLSMVPYFSTVIDDHGDDRTRMMFRIYLIQDEDVARCLHREKTRTDSS